MENKMMIRQWQGLYRPLLIRMALGYVLCCCGHQVSAQNNGRNRLIDSLQTLLKQAKHDTTRIWIYDELIHLCDGDTAMNYAKEIITIAELNLKSHSMANELKNYYSDYYAAALARIADMFYEQDDYIKALDYYKKSLKIRLHTKEKCHIAESLNSIANVYALIGNLKEALSFYSKSIKSAEGCEKEFIATCYASMGVIYLNRGEFNKSIETVNKSLHIYQKINHKEGIAYCLRLLGGVYFKSEYLPQALSNYMECLKLTKQLDNDARLSLILNDIAICYMKQGNSIKALEYADESLRITEKNGEKSSTADIFNTLGLIFREQGDIKKALMYFKKSYNIFKEIGLAEATARELINIGDLYRRQKDNPKALNYLTKGLDLSQEINNIEYIKRAADQLTTVYKQTGNYQKAFEHYQLYIKMRDSLDSKANQKAVINNQLKYEYEKEALQLKQQQTEKEVAIKLQNQAQLQRKNYWLFGSLAVLALFIISGVFIYQNTKQKQRAAAQQAIVLEQKLLRSQMNPHFIFNALNSIKHFVLKNESQQAGEHLTDFSRLMRLILESSRKELIALEDEIHILESYLKLERLQKNNSFTYTIQLSEQIKEEMDSIQIPPLLIQPLLENAIIHGLPSNGEEHGQVRVSLDLSANNEVMITIEDNGRGIQQTRSAVKVTKQRESYAIQIMNERIEGFQKKYQKNILLRIIDKAELGLAETGTQVQLTLPIVVG